MIVFRKLLLFSMAEFIDEELTRRLGGIGSVLVCQPVRKDTLLLLLMFATLTAYGGLNIIKVQNAK